MRTVLVIAAMSIAAGCASVNPQKGVLYDAYGRYSKALLDDSLVARRNELFAPSMLEKLDVHSDKDVAELTFGSYVQKEQSHYEKVDSTHGCLTLNGYEESGEPTTLFLAYQANNGGWLIDNVYVFFQEQPNFFREALCPDEARRKTMR